MQQGNKYANLKITDMDQTSNLSIREIEQQENKRQVGYNFVGNKFVYLICESVPLHGQIITSRT